jgi:glucosamine--fructose-6-phosphate aminotransferase (isomerizing)
MCGIVGYAGNQDALGVVVAGLEKLEYRGYDSAGVAMIEDGEVEVSRARGKLSELNEVLSRKVRRGVASVGIGHTRWATHGAPTEVNAHPHTAGRVSLIHNGIIENYVELRDRLSRSGVEFLSETDTEVAAHLLNQELAESGDSDLLGAFRRACSKLRGSYAMLAIDAQHPESILVAKTATPIVVGLGEDENYVASDIPAILNHTRRVIILEDGDFAEVTASSVKIVNSGEEVQRPVQVIHWNPVTAQKGGHKHYMAKEIHEQVTSISDTLRGRLNDIKGEVVLAELEPYRERLKTCNRVVLIACGTAWHACQLAKFYLESVARIPAQVDYASEFRYRDYVLDGDTLLIAISQSGETADTVAAIELGKGDALTLAICNVLGSTLTRKVDATLYTHAGPEISVASTKAFSTQLTAAYMLAIYLGRLRGAVLGDQSVAWVKDLMRLPAAVDESLKTSIAIEKVSRTFQHASSFLFLARGFCYPIALEGALKLKEISYIHAEGYPAGEIKHGPLALIDEHMPVVFLLQRDDILFEKTFSNLREVHARNGRIIAITDTHVTEELKKYCEVIVEVPFLSKHLSPIVMNVPLQFLAYFIAVAKGTDVDLPRNLAKSVTVE